MKKFILIISLVVTSATSYAIVEGAPTGSEFHLEQNNETLAAQQQYQGRIDSNREVPMNTSTTEAQPIYSSEQKASQTMTLVADREKARANLKVADTRIKLSGENHGKSIGWIAAALMAVATLVVGYYYTDKLTPNAPERRVKLNSD